MTENRDDDLARDMREALRIIARCIDVISRDLDDPGRKSELVTRSGELGTLSDKILRRHKL